MYSICTRLLVFSWIVAVGADVGICIGGGGACASVGTDADAIFLLWLSVHWFELLLYSINSHYIWQTKMLSLHFH